MAENIFLLTSSFLPLMTFFTRCHKRRKSLTLSRSRFIPLRPAWAISSTYPNTAADDALSWLPHSKKRQNNGNRSVQSLQLQNRSTHCILITLFPLACLNFDKIVNYMQAQPVPAQPLLFDCSVNFETYAVLSKALPFLNSCLFLLFAFNFPSPTCKV